MRPHDAARLHDEDFYAWTQDQAGRLRRLGAELANADLDLDLDNLAEEIESMGRSEYLRLASALFRIVEHLLKLQHSPATAPVGGWRRTVAEHRRRANRYLRSSPSLRRHLPQAVAEAWQDALTYARQGLEEDGVGADALPRDCPYTVDEILDPDWLPPRGGASAT